MDKIHARTVIGRGGTGAFSYQYSIISYLNWTASLPLKSRSLFQYLSNAPLFSRFRVLHFTSCEFQTATVTVMQEDLFSYSEVGIGILSQTFSSLARFTTSSRELFLYKRTCFRFEPLLFFIYLQNIHHYSKDIFPTIILNPFCQLSTILIEYRSISRPRYRELSP